VSQYARMHRDTRGFRPVLATFSVTCWPSVSAQSAAAVPANPVRQVGKEAAVTGRCRIAPRLPWAALPATSAAWFRSPAYAESGVTNRNSAEYPVPSRWWGVGRCSHPARR
jgi:hypothetical protein